MDLTQPGYDVEAIKDGRRLLVEVKGHLGEQKTVNLSRSQWETLEGCRHSADTCVWELWNIENIGADQREIAVTRYTNIPSEALSPTEFLVDLRQCECVKENSED